MTRTNSLLVLGAFAALALLGGCNSGGGGGETLATVEGEPITIDQFNSYLGVKPTARVFVQGQVVELPVSDTLAFQAMQDLVSRTVLFQMAKDENMMPSEQDVNAELEFQKNLDPNFIRNYQARGMTIGQIRQEVMFSLVQEKLITKGIQVTDEEVEQWLKENPRAFVDPAKVEMSWILATTPTERDEADKALKSGQSFKDVAVRYSKAPSAALVEGKYLPERGPLPIERLAENLRSQVEKTSQGQATDWIRFTEGWAKFYIDSKNPEKEIEKTKERLENVKRSLALQEGNKANDLRTRLVDRVRQSNIEVKRESLKEAWKRFADLLKAQADQAANQKSGSTPATGTTGVTPKDDSAIPGTGG
ncbi:MAG: SurA N-terminal domain-containing protein [Fimbriimonadaceae bacterium]|nr:SurA N-terminal domain-containing protein [Fimbriimonadaceae bacterium]QYK56887.1 MAG: SurA N-terminal domain-containing protein [Fimbriimonadaceae bacterium]